jgi:hypothetical protein
MNRYFSDEQLAADHGLAGREGWRSKGINWTKTIEALVSKGPC